MRNYFYTSGSGRRRRSRGSFWIKLIAPMVAVCAGFGLAFAAPPIKKNASGRSSASGAIEAGLIEEQARLAKKDLAALMGARNDYSGQAGVLDVVDANGRQFFVRTTVEPELQARGEAWVKASRAHQAALVVMNAETGEILALAGYDDSQNTSNIALSNSFPAASLFKIVTAAAALEQAQMSAESKLSYDGGKHTLYKRNLAKEPDQGHNSATLKESFADSINSVFGKIGIYTLGAEGLSDFAGRFGFNSEFDFDLPVDPSIFVVNDDDPFHLAELASGYNRSTKVSPLHGALLAASALGRGAVPEPHIVETVFDKENRIYYQAGLEKKEIISPTAAEELAKLMRQAVEKGTGRRVLQGAAKGSVLSSLIIGGKTGTINNEEGQRVDWFVAWATPRPGAACQDKLALSAVVVHSGMTTTTSQKLVRDALNAYYRDRLELKKKSG